MESTARFMFLVITNMLQVFVEDVNEATKQRSKETDFPRTRTCIFRGDKKLLSSALGFHPHQQLYSENDLQHERKNPGDTRTDLSCVAVGEYVSFHCPSTYIHL